MGKVGAGRIRPMCTADGRPGHASMCGVPAMNRLRLLPRLLLLARILPPVL